MSTLKTPSRLFRLPRSLQSSPIRKICCFRRVLTASVCVGALLAVGAFGGASQTFAQTYYYPSTTYYYSTPPVYIEPPIYVAPPKTLYVYPTYSVPAPPSTAPIGPPLQIWLP